MRDGCCGIGDWTSGSEELEESTEKYISGATLGLLGEQIAGDVRTQKDWPNESDNSVEVSSLDGHDQKVAVLSEEEDAEEVVALGDTISLP